MKRRLIFGACSKWFCVVCSSSMVAEREGAEAQSVKIQGLWRQTFPQPLISLIPEAFLSQKDRVLAFSQGLHCENRGLLLPVGEKGACWLSFSLQWSSQCKGKKTRQGCVAAALFDAGVYFPSLIRTQKLLTFLLALPSPTPNFSPPFSGDGGDMRLCPLAAGT